METGPRGNEASGKGFAGDDLLMSTTQGPRPEPTYSAAEERDQLVRELHHRVKNNLQIIVSLMNVQKRLLPAERRGEMRFLEEHVQAMAAAYRVVYASGEMIRVSMDDLIREVVSGLVDVSGPRGRDVETAGCEACMMINLDQAVTLGLLLAVALPPVLDAVQPGQEGVAIHTRQEADHVCLGITGPVPVSPLLDQLRGRLLEGHLKQLNATRVEGLPAEELRISLPKHDLV